MARRLRLQYEGAMYHVINRGNYRRDVFGSVGAAQAFEAVLFEACQCQGWQLHAFVVMRNHFHLAISTPRANLVEGMHWLQGTYAARFNRFRSERGHLFQGRYQALLIEDAAALARVVNYVHLNPVRSQIVAHEQVGTFRWSSLRRYLGGQHQGLLHAAPWLAALGFADDPAGWKAYLEGLITLSQDPAAQEQAEFNQMSRGWAIGTSSWRRELAREHSHRALSVGLSGEELREMKRARWQEILGIVLREAARSDHDVKAAAASSPWKLQIAQRLRDNGASCAWIAETLAMGSVGALRVNLHRNRQAANK